MNGLNGFQNLKFKSSNHSEIEAALSLLKTLGYSELWGGFSVSRAVEYDGICAWGDGAITEDWLQKKGFESVTLEDLKEMVGAIKNTQLVLWLNKFTLEESYLTVGEHWRGIGWVIVPSGATFATGDKDNFVFRKDGWYYNNQTSEWVKSDTTTQNLYTNEFVKLFWVNGGKDNVFTLKRLLGCEVLFENRYQSSKGHITSVYNGCSVTLNCGVIITVPNLSNLTFFTEDGDELTFDEYVERYYGDGV